MYLDPSLPVIVAVPATAAPPKLKSGVSVVDAPPWIIEDPAVRVAAVASGTTLTVTVAVAGGLLVGTTVSVYVNVPFTFPVTVTLPPPAIEVAANVPLHEAGGAVLRHDKFAGALPLDPLPPNAAKRFVVVPLLIVAVVLDGLALLSVEDVEVLLTRIESGGRGRIVPITRHGA